MNLLLDLGNTRIKWARADAGRLRDVAACAWSDADLGATLARAWRVAPPPERVLGACVTDAARRATIDSLLVELALPPAEWLRSPARHAGLVNAYAAPAQLGVDRFLALLAAWRAGLAPCVIAGCGSALTLDALGADGKHLGGLIVAGIAAMQRGLALAAPGLPAPRAFDGAIATDTRAAIGAGAWQAAAASIERFAAQQARAGGRPLRVLLAGGDAAALAHLIDGAELLPDAVLKGLAAWPEGEGRA